MEETGEVDLSILDNLKELKQILQILKNKWLQRSDNNAFYFYQGLRNIELILGKMEERFVKSKENHDNPKIALDSLVLFPVVDEVLKITEGDTIDDVTIDKVLRKTRDLRNTAARQQLIESPEVDRRQIDKEQLQWEFESVMKTLDIPAHIPYKVGEKEQQKKSEDSS